MLLCLVAFPAVVHAAVPQLPIPRFTALPDIPSPLIIPNYTDIALSYLEIALNGATTGPLLPLPWADPTAYNFPGSVLALPSYVGGVNSSVSPSEHEALTAFGTALTLSLTGGNVSDVDVPGARCGACCLSIPNELCLCSVC